MNTVIYLEPDEEITSVIDKMKKAPDNGVALVVPRGGTLAQSIVNLKLLQKSAKEIDKKIALVASDRIGRNLASQIGIPIFEKAAEAEKASLGASSPAAAKPKANFDVEGFQVNSYYARKDNEEEELGDEVDDSSGLSGGDDVSDDGSIGSENLSEEDMAEDGHDEQNDLKSEIETYRQEKEDEANRKETVEPTKTEKQPKIEENKNMGDGYGQKRANLKGTRKALLIIGSVVLVLLLAASYLALPYANAAVILKTEDTTLDSDVTAGQDIKVVDVEKMQIPGTLVETSKEMTKTYKTTGTREVGTKATGKVILTNAWDGNTHIVAAGTKLTTGSTSFVTLAPATIPAVKVTLAPPSVTPGTVEVSVEAENPGSTYNIAPATFRIAGITIDSIYGRSTTAMTGGTTQKIAILSDADVKAASADIQKGFIDTNKAELTAIAEKNSSKIFENQIALEVISEEPSITVGADGENFDYKISAKINAIAFSLTDAKILMAKKIEQGLASDKMFVNPDKATIEAEYLGILAPTETGSTFNHLKMHIKIDGKIGQKMTEKEIKDKIRNRKYSEAKSIISDNSAVESVELSIWPTAVARVPLIENRIHVKFDYSSN